MPGGYPRGCPASPFSAGHVEPVRGSAADGRHRPGRLQERRVVDAVPGALGPQRRRASARRAPSSSAPGAQRRRAGRTRSRANRQLRTWPSAVSRTRSQAPQNGRVTEAMTPTRPGPPSTSQVSAGALPRCSSGSGVERRTRPAAAARISSAVTISVAVPAVLGVQRHLLDEPQLVAAVQAPAQQRRRLVVVDPAHQHGVDLDRGQPGGGGRGQPGEHVGEPVAPGQLARSAAGRGCRG